MAASTAVMGGAQAVSSIGSAYTQSQAIQAQGEYQKAQFEINAKFANLQAKQAIKVGDKTAAEVQADAERMVGRQRAVLAAQGIDINVGSAVDIQEDTRMQAEVAAMTVKNNAWREAWGYKVEAAGFGNQAKMSEMAASNNARATLLTGLTTATSYGYSAMSGYSQSKKKGG